MKILVKRPQRGSALITALFFILIISTLLMGIGTLAVSHQGLAITESDYAAALDVAEGGINYELRKISQNTSNADQSPGVSYPMSVGNFSVYCTNTDGSTPWSQGNSVNIISVGTVNGVTRSVKITAKHQSGSGNYAVYTMQWGTLNGTATTINGDVGTNGTYMFNGHPSVNGTITFNGPSSGWQGPDPGGYSEQFNQNAVVWPTVDQIANQQFQDGGLSYVAANNDNGMVSAISHNQLVVNGNGTVTFYGKPGGANYYLTSLILNGNSSVYFDNTNGPITLWFGPSGSSGTAIFNGGTAAVKMSQSQDDPVKIYIATTNDFIMNGNTELDAGVYDYNANSSGQTWGRVIENGSPTVYGSIIANSAILNGHPTINYTGGYFAPTSGGYYGFETNWAEINLPGS